MAANKKAVSDELVPLTQRVTYMQVFRFAIVLGVMVLSLYSPRTLGNQTGTLLMGGAVYLGISLFVQGIWRALGSRSLYLFGLMLIIDGIFLAWLTYTTGGGSSPLLPVILLHLIAATLLASYRTGLKLAMWHTILLLIVYYAEVSETIAPASGASTGGSDFRRLVTFISIFWMAALATATFSAVNERELRRRRYDLEALARMSEDLDAAYKPQDVGEVLLTSLIESFDFRRGLILGARGPKISLLATHGPDLPTPDEGGFLGIDPIMRTAWDTKETQLLSELGAEELCIRSLMGETGNLLIVPLTAEGGKSGVAVLEHSIKPGSRVERRLVSIVERFCSQGALALRNAILLLELRRMATTDGLTKVANRRTFEIRLRQEISRAERDGAPLSLLILDIDNFKRLNDTYGHQTGDDVLREVAATLQAHCRNFDIAARYGGEEFTLMLPGCNAADAVTSAERLRQAIAANGSSVPVTVSVGVASYPVHATEPEELVKKADKALYASKEAGRNRVSAPVELAMSQPEE